MRRSNIIYLFTALVCSIACMADNYVIINQVMYDSPLNEKTNVSPASNGEFIELYNAGTEDVNLEGWKLKGEGVSEIWTFKASDNISAGGYLLVACQRGQNNHFQLSELYNVPDNSHIVYQNRIILVNDGETVTLCNASNDTIDQIYYDGSSHKTNPYRLHAENADSIAGDSCESLHRTWVEFDEEGKVVSGTSQWEKAFVSFGENMLPYDSYQEDYLFGSQTLSLGENYVLSATPLDPTTRININEGRVSLCSGIRTRTTLTYFDGIGREEQSIELNGTTGKQDIVTAMEYSGKNKLARQWLPVAMKTEGQRTNLVTLTAQAQSDYDDNRPYWEIGYENSVSKRQTTKTQPGSTYEGHKTMQTYALNSEEEHIRIYSVKSDSSLHTDGTYYSSSMLYKHTATDEDGISVTTYTDKQGNTIMEERADNRTYYVYDDLGRLRYILPNLSSSKLNNGDYNLDDDILKAIAYCYLYDERGNMIYKRLPGCAPQYMVYNQLRQMILKQDSIQRASGKWLLCAYDSIGRMVYVAEKTLPQTHKELIALLRDNKQVEHYGMNQPNAISGIGYASSVLGCSELRLLVVYYYDNYNYVNGITNTSMRNALQFVHESGYGIPHDIATGLLTGTRVYNLSEQGFTISTYYYDTRGRIVQNRSMRSLDSYKTATSTEYLFDGSVAQQLTEQGRGNNLVREHYRYTYDHTGRAQNTFYQLNNDDEILLSAFSYDSIGHLVQNLLYNEQDTIRYSFDIRNMLTETQNKHFSERLSYADYSSEDVTPCYNGNISAAHTAWTDTTNTFGYTYDAQNRLLSAKRLTDYSSIKSEVFSYDGAGNISTLKRYNGSRLIDNLDFEYSNDGNQLLKITDQGQDADLYSAIEYHNAEAQADTTMFYDANGNLIRDLDRGITAIRYNILNLPDTILFSNGNRIVNLYDAAGHKYKSIIYTNPVTAVNPSNEPAHMSYSPEEEYRITEYNGTIETYYTPRDTTLRIFNTIGYWKDSVYFYTLKDNLGNICAVVNANADTVVQRTMYYATGVPMAQSWGRDTQPYLYNGKEFIETHGWNTYDYGFRGYYAPIGRFTSIDPLAEKTPWQSPYTYANNNFINSIDWMGLSGLTSMADGNVPHFIVIGPAGEYLGGVDNDDWGIYIDPDGNWDPKDGIDGLDRVGRMIFPYWMYENWIGKGNKAPGIYYGNNYSISVSASIGFQAVIPAWEGDIGVALPAWELFEISYDWTDGFELNYFAKEGKANISLGVDYLGLKYEYSLQYNVRSGYMIPQTFNNGFSYQPNQYFNINAFSNGSMNLTFSYGIGIVFSIIFSGDFYYE